MRRGIIIGIVVVLLGVAAFVLDTLYSAGVFKTIDPHFAGSCRKVGGVVGAESITMAPDGRHALIAADDRRSAAAGRPVPGGIWSYDPDADAPPRNLTPNATDAFHPHGIGIWASPAGGGGRLFVVNHPDEGRLPPGEGRQTIEVYDWQPDGLVHRETLADPLIINPNAVIPTGLDTFYVTNDHGPPGFVRFFEDWLRLARGNVVYSDHGRFRIAASGISFANGVNLSADGKQLYVASTLGRELLIFDRDAASGALANRRSLFLGTAPDNVERTADGTLWIGSHPQLLKLLAASRDPEKLSPSQVLKLTPPIGGSDAAEEIYLDSGQALSASSGATVSGRHLLVGTVFDDHFLDCTMK